MASDYFLKIDGIQGESIDDKHKNEIDLQSWSWGESQAGSAAFGSGSGVAKVAMKDAQFTSTVGRQSPRLLRACANGQRIKQAILTARARGETPFEYLMVTFSDVLVASYQIGSSGDANPAEEVSLNFSKIEMEFKLQSATGGAGTSIKAGWDVKQNKSV